MVESNPFFELFDGLNRLGPGSVESTLRALSFTPRLPEHGLIADIGCGSGASTIPLAQATVCRIRSYDRHQPYLDRLQRRLDEKALSGRVQAVAADINDLPLQASSVDLIWSEGAIYIIGFDRGLRSWKPFLKPRGCIAVTELSWITSDPSEKARRFWARNYPAMRGMNENVAALASAGFDLITSFALLADDFLHGYYELLEPRALKMKSERCDDAAAQRAAAAILAEIDLWRECRSDFSYVFYVARLG